MAKQLTTIHNTDLPRWQVSMETADAHWAHTPRTGNLWSRFVKMVEQEGKEVNPHLNKGPGIRCSMDRRYYIPDLNVWTWLHDNCLHADVKGWQKGNAAAFYEIAMNLFRTKLKFNKFIDKHQLSCASVPHWSMTTRFHKAVSLNADGVRVWSPIGVAKEFITSGLDELKIDVLVGYFGHRRQKAELGRAYRNNILDENGVRALSLVDQHDKSRWTEVFQSAIVPPPAEGLPPLGLEPEGLKWSDNHTVPAAGPSHMDTAIEDETLLDYGDSDGYDRACYYTSSGTNSQGNDCEAPLPPPPIPSHPIPSTPPIPVTPSIPPASRAYQTRRNGSSYSHNFDGSTHYDFGRGYERSTSSDGQVAEFFFSGGGKGASSSD
ncbi:hypothetical protein DACRYDRAFT_104480 [Dacryopinax primogenitus]|uniref:Uncharacterized protein n=1 Tax=Dacryopinax primogenitus (strain DJM 731) TaxID=1858805 RepID=M5GFZ5_DACPD|nr:uncharacterized protein DACRYDRAFT_104480 [Dacryopinax primogenitus]EJU04598.1 hypothetical protein DACRYDRAFT_104480 [Dacryopinax primogenitus]